MKHIFVKKIIYGFVLVFFCFALFYSLNYYKSHCVVFNYHHHNFYGALALKLKEELGSRGYSFSCPAFMPKTRVSFVNTKHGSFYPPLSKDKNIAHDIAIFGDCEEFPNIVSLTPYDVVLGVNDVNTGQMAMFNFRTAHLKLEDTPKYPYCNTSFDEKNINLKNAANFLDLIIQSLHTNEANSKFLQNISQEQKITPNYDTAHIVNCTVSDADLTGERFFGYDLTDAIKQIIPNASVHVRTEDYSHSSAGVQIFMRGYFKFTPPFPDNRFLNIAYVFYPLKFTHPNHQNFINRDKLSVANIGALHSLYDELQFYDALAVASQKYANKLNKAGFKAYYVPQFTNTDRFYPDYDEALKSEVLYVGSNKGSGTPNIVLNSGLPIALYGDRWNGAETGNFADNAILRKYYSSAKIVLNSHRDDMKENGFINNRTFDATACGTLMISDYVPEIEEIYGDSIPMWKTEEELISLVKYYLDPAHEQERLDKAHRAREITLKNFTHKKTAERFNTIIQDLKRTKNLQ